MRNFARWAVLVAGSFSLLIAFETNVEAQAATAAFPPVPAEAKPATSAAAPTARPAATASSGTAPAAAPPASASMSSGAPAPAVSSAPRPAPVPPPPAAYPEAYPREPSPPSTRDPEVGSGVPPPPEDPRQGFRLPDISLRADPLNLLLEGRLGLEFEAALSKFLSVELVPVFVTTKSPPTLNYSSLDSTITQSSNGIGPISGAALDAGFWFGRKPLQGEVLRVGLSNYSYSFQTRDSAGPIDSVTHTEREFFVMFGQHSRWGAFTIEGAVGLGYELNQENRCFVEGTGSIVATSNCPKKQRLILLDQRNTVGDLTGFVYPFDLLARFSLGVVF